MSLDLGTPVIEVALGLAFVFFLLSIVVSSAVEGIAKIFQLRERKLERGVERMLGDVPLAEEVLRHPLFKVDVNSTKRRPAYVSSRNFALALVQILKRRGTDGEAGEPVEGMPRVVSGVRSFGEQSAVRLQLEGLLEAANGSVDEFRKTIRHWFDDGMDRVSGWYRTWTQVLTCVLALAVAVGLNVDAIRIAERLSNDSTLRTAVVGKAEASVSSAEEGKEGESNAGGGSEGGGSEGGEGEGESATSTPADAGEAAEEAIGEVKELNLPILWSEQNDNVTLNTLAGWLITFLALSLGSPFWWSALSKLAHLKTAGNTPQPAK